MLFLFFKAMEIITNYLIREKQLVLTAGLLGVASFAVGLLVLILATRYKSFSASLLILGALEAGVFLSVYFFRSDVQMKHKMEKFNSNATEYVIEQRVFAEKALNSFFWLKIVYALLLLVATVICSKLNAGNVWNGILFALIIHLALAITIDNIGEQYTKIYSEELLKLN